MHQGFKSLQSLLRLNQLGWNRRQGLQELLQAGFSPEEIEEKILADNLDNQREKLLAITSCFEAVREIDQCQESAVQLLPINSPDYPAGLRKLYQPPLVLYVRGQIHSLDQAALAMVGTRHPSLYGIRQARRFSTVFSESGLTIVSGLAKGIDREAHDAALAVRYGRSLAVLGCGVDRVYPPEHESLYERIQAQGAILSEYPLGSLPLAHHFPARNRIIAGLSQAVLVVEAHYRSGALITAHEALEQGKDVYAVPGQVDQITSRGTHRLIKEGAYLAESPEEILESVLSGLSSFTLKNEPLMGQGEYAPRKEKDKAFETSEKIDEKMLLILTQVRQRPFSHEELMEVTQFASSELLVLMTRLEMMGKVIRRPNSTFEARTP